MKKQTPNPKRRIRKLPLLAGAIVALLVSGSANADWAVKDKDAIKELETANDKLGDIYSSHQIGSHKASGEMVTDPELKIEKGTITLTTGTERCKSANQEQKTTCEDIAKTENSQYLYMVKMFEITTKRKEILEEIENERSGLSGEKDFGKLQNNTNKLLALNARMSLDRAQMESAMHAYETRLRYLRQFQAQQTKDRLTGNKTGEGSSPFGDITAIGSTLAAGAVMKTTLETLKSDDPEKKMGWL